MSDSIALPDSPTLDWREFLTDRPPGSRGLVDRPAIYALGVLQLRLPEIPLYCDGMCNCESYCTGHQKALGKLFGDLDRQQATPFSASQSATSHPPTDAVVWYACETCGKVLKSYSLRFGRVAHSPNDVCSVEVLKIAEWPPFSPRTPSKVMALIGPDRDLFLKGRRAEIEGLGIAAFAYYRRIVEGQKNRLVDAIIRVASHLKAANDVLTVLESAKAETQFKKAIETVKDAIPPVLFIKGHNPLTLLHSALSECLHDETDENCLLAANDVRLILIQFAEKLSEAMKDQKELDQAVNRLVSRQN